MKSFLTCILSALTIIGCNNKSGSIKSLNDLEAANIKGKVIKIKESYHKVGDACCPAGDKKDYSLKITRYSPEGYTLETTQVGIAGDTIMRSLSTYNDQNECTLIENFSLTGMVSREINEVEEGLVKAVKTTDVSGNILNAHQFKYKNGLLASGKTFTGEGDMVQSFTNEYRDGKLVTLIIKNSKGKISSITRNKINESGDCIESTVIHPSDSSEFTVNYDYEYDESGNWVKQTKIYNEDIVSIKVREIEYLE